MSLVRISWQMGKTEDGSCMDKAGQMPTTLSPLTSSMMTGGATGGATGGEDIPEVDVESADMIDAVKQVEKEGEKAEQLESVDKENVAKLKDEVKIDRMLLAAQKNGDKTEAKKLQNRLDIAADTMAKKEDDDQTKKTVGKVETTIKNVVEQQTFAQEEQQELMQRRHCNNVKEMRKISKRLVPSRMLSNKRTK